MATEHAKRSISAIPQFCINNPAFSEGGERWKIFNAESNGMEDLGVIVRIGRRVYYDEDRYFLWVELQNTGELDAVVKIIREVKETGKYIAPEEALAVTRGVAA